MLGDAVIGEGEQLSGQLGEPAAGGARLGIGALELHVAARPALAPRLAGGAVDIEALVQWAIAQTGYLPWRNPSAEDLAMDHGWDCVPKSARALYQQSGGIALKCKGGIAVEAVIVVQAIKALPAAMAAQVIPHAREASRPNALIGIEPRRVGKKVYGRKRNGKRRGRPATVMSWAPCSPEAICDARSAYSLWHAGLSRLAKVLMGQLTHWEINGFAAPAAPWETA